MTENQLVVIVYRHYLFPFWEKKGWNGTDKIKGETIAGWVSRLGGQRLLGD